MYSPREAYTQNRTYKIYDGNPPASENNDDDWDEEDFDAEDEETEEEAPLKPRIRLESAPPADITQDQPDLPVPDAEVRRSP